MNSAILVVSFGTTHLDTLENNIAKTEAEIAAAFPDSVLYRAFTSHIVRRRLKEKFGIAVDTVEDALSRIAQDGHTQVILQPTLLIPGEEYDRLKASAAAAKGNLQLFMGRPLLCNDKDLEEIIAILRKAYPVEDDTVLVAMGHGTYHAANSLYEQLAEKMHKQVDHRPMLLATVEGTPSFADTVNALSSLPHKKVHLFPLMLVAGDHAKNDMAGDEPDSLRSLLENAGLIVSYSLQGLGELEAVRQMYVCRAQEAFRPVDK